MHIISIRPEPPGRNAIARFDVQLDGMRLFNLALKHTASGYRVFAPSAFGSAAATFAPDVSEMLVRAARGALGEIRQHDRQHAA